MRVEDFTGREAVRTAVAATRDAVHGKPFSDIVDEEGNQYVDLVMEGGGVLGIALVGYTYALEEAGIRFLGVGGTSAGSINALLAAAAGPPAERKSPRLLSILADFDPLSFVDGGSAARDLMKVLAADGGAMRLAWKLMPLWDEIKADLGINPGNAFLRWLKAALADLGLASLRDLAARMNDLPPGLSTRSGRPLSLEEAAPRLGLVAAEVVSETKVEFPKHAPLFWEEPGEVNPALFARASMSIPFFFQPLRVKVPPQNAVAWRTLAHYDGPIPEQAVLVDGGIVSNFPVDLFHGPENPPLAPTFGAKLGSARRQVHAIEGPGSLLSALFDSARHCLDYDFLARHPDYRHLVAHIRTDGISWLDFALPEAKRLLLFQRGVEAAGEFLRTFDWPAYRALRTSLRAWTG